MDEMSRRVLVGRAGLAAALAMLPGCRTTPGSGAGSGGVCDLPQETGIDWILPDVARPIYFGVTDGMPTLEPANFARGNAPITGPPRRMLIYYPSEDLADQRLMLRPCIGRYPLVIFLHGNNGSISGVNYHEKWRRICSTIASCGYVVAAPVHQASPEPEDAAVAAVARDVAWLRTQWWGAPWLDARPDSTSYIGHSWGAVLAGRAASELPAAAYASLGGGLVGSSLQNRLKTFPVPTFYAYLDQDSPGYIFNENLDSHWDDFASPRWRAVYKGEHFDYLDPADSAPEPRGTQCKDFPQAMAGLVTLFLGANVVSHTAVDIDLKPVSTVLTERQRLFRRFSFTGLDLFEQSRSCRIDLSWNTPIGAGTRKIGRG